MATVHLSLGSNVRPEHYMPAALSVLRRDYGAVTVSPLYRTRAVGFAGADFLNAAARLDTELSPEHLNTQLHAVEAELGRRRDGPRYSSRTLDIDLLLYDDVVTTGAGHLQLPRAELAEQAFVLKPMVDIAPELMHPTLGQTLAQLWADFPSGDQGLQPVAWPAV